MKLTKKRLSEIIQEELNNFISEKNVVEEAEEEGVVEEAEETKTESYDKKESD